MAESLQPLRHMLVLKASLGIVRIVLHIPPDYLTNRMRCASINAQLPAMKVGGNVSAIMKW